MNQKEAIIDFILREGSITQRQALRHLGIMRLASRISDLRKDGFVIDVEMVPVPTRYGKRTAIARYRIHSVVDE